jgi:hypothetical protein
MSMASADTFEASLPGATQTVRIASLHDAQVFARRWVIRDKDPVLKALLRHMERANSSATADVAVRELKQALERRGMLITASAQNSDRPRPR